MKIGIDISQIVFEGTGVASYTKNLTRSLLEQYADEFFLFGASLRRYGKLLDFLKEVPNTSTAHGRFLQLPPSLLSFLWNQWHRIKIENIVGNVDVFHSSDWIEPPSNRPKVTTIHDLVVYTHPQTLHPKIVATQKARLTWVQKESTAIIADSQSTKNDVIDYLHIPEEEIHVVPLGVGEMFHPRSVDEVARVKKKYGIEKKYILSVGTQEPRKNIARLIAACQQINSEYELVIVGNIGWGNQIKPIDGVTSLGFVHLEDLPALYSGAYAFAYPSLYEGFGLPILEASACGVPIITSSRGSLAEIAPPTVFTVDPENTESISEGIQKTLSLSPDKYRDIQQNVLEHSKQFTWQKTAEKTYAVYKSIVQV